MEKTRELKAMEEISAKLDVLLKRSEQPAQLSHPYDLWREGGDWIGAARSYLKCHTRGGDTCTWGSDTDHLTMSVRDLELFAATAVHADRGRQESLQKIIEKLERKLLQLDCENHYMKEEIARQKKEDPETK